MERGSSVETPGEIAVRLWLPHNALVELRTLVLEPQARLEPAAPESRRRWIHYGSSISHCLEAIEPALI